MLFHSYINDLPDGLLSNVKLFADDTAVFSTVLSARETTNELKQDLAKIKDWAVQWKMLFNPDHNKPAKEVIFSRKINKDNHPPIFFNNTPIKTCSNETHLGLTLDEKLDFKCHTQEKINKAMRGVGIIRKLSLFLPRFSLLTIYKSFVRPLLDYGDVIYDQPINQSISDRTESVQYNAALAITGAIRGTSRIKIYKELGLESLKDRRWTRRLCYFNKIYHSRGELYRVKKYRSARNLESTFFLVPNDIVTLFITIFWGKIEICMRQVPFCLNNDLLDLLKMLFFQ